MTADKTIGIEKLEEDGCYRLVTHGWHQPQEWVGSADEILEFLLSASDNGHRHVTVFVWSDQR